MARRIHFSLMLVAACAVLLYWYAPVSASQLPTNGRPPGVPATQSPALKAPAVSGPWTGPKTPDGQPDVQGIWRSDTAGLSHSLEEGEDPGDDPDGRAVAKPPNVIFDPADGRMPYQPWALAKKRENLVNLETPTDLEHIDPDDKCWLPGLPRSIYARSLNLLQITQAPGYVMLFYPSNHVHRIIPLGERPPLTAGVKLFMGYSRARWEGNTLVVDVTNLDDRNWLDSHGSFHSDAMHVVERWTFESRNRASVEATMEDPKVFTKPWKIRIEHARVNEESDDFAWEHACFEGERNVQRILAIGRKMKAAGKTGIHTHNLPVSIK